MRKTLDVDLWPTAGMYTHPHKQVYAPHIHAYMHACTHSHMHANTLEENRCGSLNVIGPHNLIGSGITGRCGFVRLGMILLKEMCHCGGGL